MTESNDKRVLRSKHALKETFLSLLNRKSFDHISISEIVREADYNRGTFYANFETKDELLREVVQDALDDLIEQIRRPYRTESEVKFREMRTDDITVFQYLQDNAERYKLLLSDHIRVDFRYQLAEAIEKLFIDEYEYELADGTVIDPQWLYIYRAHGVAGLMIRWVEDDFPAPPAYMGKQIVELMMLSTESFQVKS